MCVNVYQMLLNVFCIIVNGFTCLLDFKIMLIPLTCSMDGGTFGAFCALLATAPTTLCVFTLSLYIK